MRVTVYIIDCSSEIILYLSHILSLLVSIRLVHNDGDKQFVRKLSAKISLVILIKTMQFVQRSTYY